MNMRYQAKRAARERLERARGFDRTAHVTRNGELVPRTIDYQCRRCLLTLPSQPIPTDPDELGIYRLPEGWTLIARPVGQDDEPRCVECQKDVARGAPEVLG